MNKEQAAEYLGFSVKNLQRLMKEKKIQFTYIKGKNGQQAYFEQAELDRYKFDQEKQSNIISPSVVVENNPSTSISKPSSKGSSILINTSDLMNILEKIAQGLTKQNQQVMFPINERMTLTTEEVSGISGFPLGAIKRAIKEGALKAVKVGRAKRVRREDLEVWVKGL